MRYSGFGVNRTILRPTIICSRKIRKMTQRVPTYSPLPGPAHPTSVSEAVAVKFSPEAVAEALTQCEQETYLIRLITPLQSNTEARLLVKSWHACRKSANLNHLMAHLDDRYEPALIKALILALLHIAPFMFISRGRVISSAWRFQQGVTFASGCMLHKVHRRPISGPSSAAGIFGGT